MTSTLSRQAKVFLLLSCCFTVLLVVSNIIAGKIIIVGTLMAPAAVICYSLTFAITDTLAEIWGKERTQFVVNLGFLTVILSAVFIRLALVLPSAPLWHGQEVFAAVLGSNLRMVAASLTAYVISQYHDVWAFTFWKEKTNGRHLWLRNNLSTTVSQLLDTVVFITLAFYGTGVSLWSMIAGQYLVKVIIAFCDTPLVYALVYLIKKYAKFEELNSPAKQT
ncbi:MAG TPA: queuosine precursor transporter [Oscillospiraceae bacterium]|nr:queuosine precursor transporter [Oscillospiraceae bacterium]